jgi:exodeoxyribonuclease V beta subunit
LTTDEASEMLFVLKAVVEINAGKINKALLTSLTDLTIDEVLELDEEHILNQFKLYQQIWNSNGVYVMLLKFISDFKVKSALLKPNVNNGERKLSNVLQLAELLHKVSVRKQYMPTELINWLNKGIEGKINEGDEFEQRVENDEDAVKIISIHKCKGLEYNIVLAPFLDLNNDPRDIANFRKEDGTYWFTDKIHLTAEQLELTKTQAEQENRRLIYVALTRAKYKFYLHRNIYHNESALSVFTANPNSFDPNLIEYSKLEDIKPVKNLYADKKPVFAPNYETASNFSLLQPNWMKLSYTFLSPEHQVVTKFESSLISDEYSKFVFNQLKRGAHTGNLLHYIFEHIDFSDDSRWERIIQQALKRLSGVKDDALVGQLVLMLHQVLNAKISTGETSFSLNQIKKDKRLDELEFDMIVPDLSTHQLQDLSNPEIPFKVKNISQIEGMLNGRVDLFFEHEGKFYILDWKSNFLGNNLEDYSIENVKIAMMENNYNLQYLIYTIALIKYLGTRKKDFDYERDFGGVIYFFVRGVRVDGGGGMFFNKPQWEVVEKISALLSK